MMKNRATLVVDATNLYKIVFEGVKSHALQKQNIHAVWGFLKKLRGLLNENITNSEHPFQIGKVILFWDGMESGKLRKQIYPEYKEKRNRYFNGIDVYYGQKEVIKILMETLGISSYSHDFVETDDCISEYIRQNPQETIFILSNDHDYFQLISKKVYVYYLNRIKVHGRLYPYNPLINVDNFEYFFDYNPKNILLRKIILGDESDNIVGAKGFSEKSIINEIPMFIKKVHNRDSLLEYAETQQKQRSKESKRLSSLINFLRDDSKFLMNEQLINLNKDKFINEDCKKDIEKIERKKIDLKKFHDICKEKQITAQIKTDLDFNGDVRFFCEPFLLTHKQ